MSDDKKANYRAVTDPIVGCVLLPFVPVLELAARLHHRYQNSDQSTFELSGRSWSSDKPWRKPMASAVAFLFAATQGFVMWVLLHGIIDGLMPGASAVVNGLTAGVFSASSFWVNYNLANTHFLKLIAPKDTSEHSVRLDGDKGKETAQIKQQTMWFALLFLPAICAAVLVSALIFNTIMAHPLGAGTVFSSMLPGIAAGATMLISCVLYVGSAWDVSKRWAKSSAKQPDDAAKGWLQQRIDELKANKLKVFLGVLVIAGMVLTSIAGIGPVHELLVSLHLETAGQNLLSTVAAVLCTLGEIAFALQAIDRLGNDLKTIWPNCKKFLSSLLPIKQGKFDPSKAFDQLLLVSKIVVIGLTISGTINTAGIAPLVIMAVYMAIPAIKAVHKKIWGQNGTAQDALGEQNGSTAQEDALGGQNDAAQAVPGGQNDTAQEGAKTQRFFDHKLPAHSDAGNPELPSYRYAAMNGVSNGFLSASPLVKYSPLWALVLIFGALQSFALTSPSIPKEDTTNRSQKEEVGVGSQGYRGF